MTKKKMTTLIILSVILPQVATEKVDVTFVFANGVPVSATGQKSTIADDQTVSPVGPSVQPTISEAAKTNYANALAKAEADFKAANQKATDDLEAQVVAENWPQPQGDFVLYVDPAATAAAPTAQA